MNLSPQFIEEVKERTDILDLISSYVELKGRGKTYKGLCPFHSEKTPSFTVNTTDQYYKCFGCQKGGDAINFVMEIERLSFYEAVKFLAERCNMEMPKAEIYDEQSEIQRKTLLDLNVDCAKFYRKCLFENELAMKYLKERKVSDAMIRKFGLGYAPFGNLISENFKDKYGLEFMEESGILKKIDNQYKDKFINRIMFPIFNYRGKVIGFGGRSLDSYGPKYLNSPETEIFHKKNNLYAFNFAKKSSIKDSVILAEGYMDVITLYQYGFDNAVASLGTAFTPEQAKVLKAKGIKKVYISYDSDTAGQNAALKAVPLLLEVGIAPFVVNMPGEKDPDDFLKQHGAGSYKKSMLNALNFLAFKINYIKKGYDLTIDNQKNEYARKICGILKEAEKQGRHILVEEEIKNLSFDTGISVKAIGQTVYGKYFSPKRFKEIDRTTSGETLHIDPDKPRLKRENQLLKFLSNHPEYTWDKNFDDFVFTEGNFSAFKNIWDGIESEKCEDEISVEDGVLLLETVYRDSVKKRIEELTIEQKKAYNPDEQLKIGIRIIELQRKLK